MLAIIGFTFVASLAYLMVGCFLFWLYHRVMYGVDGFDPAPLVFGTLGFFLGTLITLSYFIGPLIQHTS